MVAREPMPPIEPRYADSGDEELRPAEKAMRPGPEPELEDWGVPSFEPLNIHTAEFDRVPALDGPMMIDADPATGRGPAPGTVSRPVPAISSAAPAAERPRIVTILGCTVGEARWCGTRLLEALALRGLSFWR